MRIQRLVHVVAPDQAVEAGHLAALSKQDHRGDGLHVEGAGRIGVRLDVDAVAEELPGPALRDLLEPGLQCSARRAGACQKSNSTRPGTSSAARMSAWSRRWKEEDMGLQNS